MPLGLCIEKKERPFAITKLSGSVLNLPKDSAFLFMLPNLFHTLIPL